MVIPYILLLLLPQSEVIILLLTACTSETPTSNGLTAAPLIRTRTTWPQLSYDMQTGKYYLEHSGNVKQHIEKTGRLPTRFKPNGSGFFTAKERYEEAKADPSCLHFMPDLSYKRHKSMYTPITDKFMGYVQFPYQADLPEHLELSNQKAAKIANFEKEIDSTGLRLVKHHRQTQRRHLTRRRI